MRHAFLVLLLLASGLAACAVNTPYGVNSGCGVATHPSDSSIWVDDPLFLPALLLYGLGCEGVHALERHGAFDSPPEGSVKNGVYIAADGTFSVELPAPSIREQYGPQRDYVFFLPRLGGSGPVFGVSITPELEPIYGSLSIHEYAVSALRDSMLESRRVSGASLMLLHEEELTLSGRPALFQAYSQIQEGAQAKPSAYYLVYFLKTKHRAAVLSVSLPGDCPPCTGGTEADVRTLSPAIKTFVESFRLADPAEYR